VGASMIVALVIICLTQIAANILLWYRVDNLCTRLDAVLEGHSSNRSKDTDYGEGEEWRKK
jgi:hypothetical protein